MVIDDRIEPVVRGIFGAVVKRDEDKLDAALQAFPDDASRLQGLQLAIAICGFVVHDAYGGKPSAEEVRALAQEVAAMCIWAELSADDVSQFIDAVLNGRALADIFDPETATMLTFIVTGGLIASSEKIRKDEWWFNYLDRVEAAIEATPAP